MATQKKNNLTLAAGLLQSSCQSQDISFLFVLSRPFFISNPNHFVISGQLQIAEVQARSPITATTPWRLLPALGHRHFLIKNCRETALAYGGPSFQNDHTYSPLERGLMRGRGVLIEIDKLRERGYVRMSGRGCAQHALNLFAAKLKEAKESSHANN